MNSTGTKDFLIMSDTPATVRFQRVTLPSHLPLPQYAHPGDSGMDLLAAESANIPPGGTKVVDTGLKVALPPGFEGQVRSRSGLAAKNGICVLNSPGTVDCGYRGPLKVILHNSSEVEYHVSVGDRIAQMVLAPVYQFPVEEVEDVDSIPSDGRGEGGFGSTGR